MRTDVVYLLWTHRRSARDRAAEALPPRAGEPDPPSGSRPGARSAGILTRNEPTQFAVRESIERAVYAVVMEGAKKGLWKFRDQDVGQRLIQQYIDHNASAPAAAIGGEVVAEAVVSKA